MKDNIHDGHRERMKEKFIEGGLDQFASHEVLELLLFNSIPRQNTNPIAHDLIDTFASLEGVMSADIDELCNVRGVGIRSALLIKLVGEIDRRVAIERSQIKGGFKNIGEVQNYFMALFKGIEHERLYMIMLDNSMRLIKHVLITEGTPNSAEVSFRTIIEHIALNKAVAVFIGHNHPHGLPVPSGEDYAITQKLKVYLAQIEVNLIDHIIVGDNKCFSIMNVIRQTEKGNSNTRTTSPVCYDDSAFDIDTFYQNYDGLTLDDFKDIQ